MNALFRNSAIRRGREEDIPFMLEVGRERYGDRASEISVPWIKWHLKNPASLVLIGSATVGLASINLHYGFEKRARLDMLAAKHEKQAVFEALQQVRAMVRWAAINGAEGAFKIDADTGVDFGPFAKRLGGVEVDPKIYPRYEIPLDGGML